MAQPPQNPKPCRTTQCHRHPDLPTTTGLCAPCLRERLSLLTPSTSSSTTTTTTTSTSATSAALRRCKTFSAKNCDVVLGVEPRRRSCDVRGRSSLYSLFDLDDNDENDVVSVESKNLGFLCKGTCTVLEEEEISEEIDVRFDDSKVRVSNFGNVFDDDDDEFEDSKTMKEFIDLEFEANNSNSRSNYSNRKDFKEVAGSFWIAASVFSKKFRKWGKKQQRRENECKRSNVGRRGGDGGGLGEMKLENLRGRRLRDGQSEVGECGLGRRSCDMDPRGSIDYGRASIDCGGFGRRSCDMEVRGPVDFGRASIDCGGLGRRSCDTDARGSIDLGGGRRSCDSDPRFSIDLGRASVDCGRISVDEGGRAEFDAPRASWDGYLLGGRAALPRGNGNVPMVSVIENAMATVYGFDNRVLSEGKMKVENGRDRERWRNGIDRSSEVKRDTMGVIDDDEVKGLSNAKVSPAAIGIFNGAKLLITEKELNAWRLNSSSLRDDNSSESFETASKDLASVSSSSNGKVFKKCRQWSKLWSAWGLLNRNKGDKSLNEEGEESVDHSARKLTRSQSSSSSRSSSVVGGSNGGTTGRNELKAIVRSKHEAVVLHRNRSSRFSPNSLDNGLLRFYLPPLRSRRRNSSGKSRLKNSTSLARSVLRL